jgi:hypothetical protein
LNEPSGICRRTLLRRAGGVAAALGAGGALVRADVPNDDDRPALSRGDPVAVHLPARHLRVLAPDGAAA